MGRLQHILEAGAQFAQTQFCMDAEILRRYVARLEDSGLGGKLLLLVGVSPLASAKSARWIKTHLFESIIPDWIVDRLDRARDSKAEGRAICIDLLKEFARSQASAALTSWPRSTRRR